jgi:uncharacterized protein (DUF4415 family)
MTKIGQSVCDPLKPEIEKSTKNTFATHSVSDRAKLAEALERVTRYSDSLTPEKDAALQRAAEAALDNPPIPDDAKFVTYPEARRRGLPKIPSPKQLVTLRLDQDVLDFFRAKGAGWQVRINETLRREKETAA